jgi:hypothetical protein
MEPPEPAVVAVNQQSIQSMRHQQNTMCFPQALRDTIPTTPGCWGRALALSSITGDSRNSPFYGRQVVIQLEVCETGKLTGVFDVVAHLNLEAARALAKTLTDLVEQAEKRPVTFP